MKSIVEFGAVFAVGILNHMMGAFFYSKRFDCRRYFSLIENLLRYWVASISGIFVVLLVAINQPNGLASVGIIGGAADKNPFFIGVMFTSFVMLFLASIQWLSNSFRKISPGDETVLSNPVIQEMVQYQSRIEKLAYLTVLPFIVASEDLIYRGYLVLMLGQRTHSYLPWIILSVVLSVIIHLYQGKNVAKMLYHATFALYFIALTLWTGNVMTAIVAHFFYDFIGVVSVWQKADKMNLQLVRHGQSKRRLLSYWVFIATNISLLVLSLWFISSAN